jgi:hypothetical protein
MGDAKRELEEIAAVARRAEALGVDPRRVLAALGIDPQLLETLARPARIDGDHGSSSSAA